MILQVDKLFGKLLQIISYHKNFYFISREEIKKIIDYSKFVLLDDKYDGYYKILALRVCYTFKNLLILNEFYKVD